MNKRNYDQEFTKCIEEHQKKDQVPSLLLHACCAPCSSSCLERVTDDFHVTIFFYNPNITEENEYRMRVEEEKRLIREMPAKYEVSFLEGDYIPKDFFEKVKGLEDEPERGKRCTVCYEMRLRESAKVAKELNFDYFATTLTLSPLKDTERLNTLGENLGNAYGVSYLPSDFKKKNGYLRSIELSKEYDLYRQNFCGCVFSKREPDLEEGLLDQIKEEV